VSWLKNLPTTPTKWFVRMRKLIPICLFVDNDDDDYEQTAFLIRSDVKTSVALGTN